MFLQTKSRNKKLQATPHTPSMILKSRGMRGALWFIDALCSTIESIQESTIGPIHCTLATSDLGTSKEFPPNCAHKEMTVGS